jgi:hypothetical protein
MADAARHERLTRILLCAGAAAGPAFLGTALIVGAQRTDYRPLRHPVSSLARGPGGPVQTLNFLLTGTLYLGGAVGLARSSGVPTESRAVPILIGSAAVGLIGAGVFVTDPVSGYPADTIDRPTENTPAGWLHQIFSAPTFLALPTAAAIEAVSGWRQAEKIWALYSAKSAAASMILFALANAGFAQQPRLVDRAGLLQRLAIGTAFGWLTAISLRRLRRLA